MSANRTGSFYLRKAAIEADIRADRKADAKRIQKALDRKNYEEAVRLARTLPGSWAFHREGDTISVVAA